MEIHTVTVRALGDVFGSAGIAKLWVALYTKVSAHYPHGGVIKCSSRGLIK